MYPEVDKTYARGTERVLRVIYVYCILKRASDKMSYLEDPERRFGPLRRFDEVVYLYPEPLCSPLAGCYSAGKTP